MSILYIFGTTEPAEYGYVIEEVDSIIFKTTVSFPIIYII